MRTKKTSCLKKVGPVGSHHFRAELGEDVDEVETDDLHLRGLLRRVAERQRYRHQLRPLMIVGRRQPGVVVVVNWVSVQGVSILIYRAEKIVSTTQTTAVEISTGEDDLGAGIAGL